MERTPYRRESSPSDDANHQDGAAGAFAVITHGIGDAEAGCRVYTRTHAGAREAGQGLGADGVASRTARPRAALHLVAI